MHPEKDYCWDQSKATSLLQERLIGGQRGQKTFTGSQKRKVSFVQSMVNLSALIMVFHCHFCSAGFVISFVKADCCTKLSCINNIFLCFRKDSTDLKPPPQKKPMLDDTKEKHRCTGGGRFKF